MSGTLPAIIFGIAVIFIVVFLLIKQYETRMVLMGAGFLMAIVAADPLFAFKAFSDGMVRGSLIVNICSALGFAAVLQITKCDKHLVFGMAKGLKFIRPLLIPAAALATYLVNIAIPSAAGCAAAVGVVMIPLMVSQGVHPAVAASAIVLGTFGSTLSPALSHNAVVADLATKSLGVEFTTTDFIKTIAWGSIPAFLIGATSLTLIAKFRKEDKGYVDSSITPEEIQAMQSFKVKPFLAVLPLLPIVFLITFSFLSTELKDKTKPLNMSNAEIIVTTQNLAPTIAETIEQLSQRQSELGEKLTAAKTDADKKAINTSIKTLASATEKLTAINLKIKEDQIKANEDSKYQPTLTEQTVLGTLSFFKFWGWTMSIQVPHVMLLGAFLCLLFTRTNPQKATKEFFNGMGKGYGDVLGIIIAAGVFVSGMDALGLISSATAALEGAQNVAGVAAAFGPFLMAVISGSGDAAALAFNESVTGYAASFGFQVADMGALAALTGSLGRSMSPIAGVTILIAGMAKVNPFEVAKRNALGMVLGACAAMFIMLYS